MSQLPRPVLDSKSGAGIASRETESSNATADIIGKELQVKQETVTTGPAAQNLFPATLLLVAVGKSNMDVLEREVILGKFLQTQDDGVLGGVRDPRALGNKGSSYLYPMAQIRTPAIVQRREWVKESGPWRIPHLER